jgi:hypothetical protein
LLFPTRTTYRERTELTSENPVPANFAEHLF